MLNNIINSIKKKTLLYVNIILTALSPYSKKLLLYKILTENQQAEALFLVTLVFLLAPYITLGWSDFLSRQLAKNIHFGVKKHGGSFFISINIAIFFSFIFSFFLYLYKGYSLGLSTLVFFDLFLFSTLYTVAKLYRGVGAVESFFFMLSLRAFVDLLIYFTIFLVNKKIHLVDVVIIDCFSTCIPILLGVFYCRLYRPIWFNFSYSYFRCEYRNAARFIIFGLAASFFQVMDLVFYKKILPGEEYRMYFLIMINASLIYSFKSFIYQFIFNDLVKSSENVALANKNIQKYRQKIFMFLLMLAPLQCVSSYYFFKFFYSSFHINLIQVSLSFLIGSLAMLQIDDALLVLRFKIKKVVSVYLMGTVLFISGCVIFINLHTIPSVSALMLFYLFIRLFLFLSLVLVRKREFNNQEYLDGSMNFKKSMEQI